MAIRARVMPVVSSAMVATAMVATATVTAASGAAAQQTVRGWAAAPDAAVRVFNLGGSTRVVGWDHDSVAVTGTVAAGGRLFGGGSPSALKVGIEPGTPAGDPPAAVLEVRVPRGAQLSVKSSSADVEVTGVSGTIEVTTVSGTVAVTGRARQVTVEGMTGDVIVRAAAPVIRVRTAGGDATVEGAVEDLRVETVSGAILVRVPRPRQARLESATGSVSFDGGLAADAALEIQTHESAIRVTLPSAVAASFDLTTFDGLLVNRFGKSAARPSRGGKPLRFTVNGGGARVTVRTLKGDIEVYRR